MKVDPELMVSRVELALDKPNERNRGPRVLGCSAELENALDASRVAMARMESVKMSCLGEGMLCCVAEV